MSKVNELHVNGQVLPKIKLKNGFTQISNAVLLDERLSFKARGILALLLSRPADWRIYLSEISERSNKDGKKAVQSGFKELVAFGYLELTAFINEQSGHFEGKGYAICNTATTHRQRPFRSVPKAERPVLGQSPKRIDLKEDVPKMASYSNTNSSNTKNTNTKKQQHHKAVTHKIDVADEFEKIKKDIITFYPPLLSDTNWQLLYTATPITSKRQLSIEEIYLLILHFKDTSLKAGTVYADISEVKKHFANWFQANLAKKSLLQFIQSAKKTEQNARTYLFPLIAKVNVYFDILLKQQCENLNHAIDLQSRLEVAKKELGIRQPLLSKIKERESIENLLTDIEKMLGKLQNAANKERLDWFCLQAAACQVV